MEAARTDVTNLIWWFYALLIWKPDGVDMATDRQYWRWYISAVTLITNHQKPPPAPVPASHLATVFPPLTDAAALDVTLFLKYITKILDNEGVSRYTPQEILDGHYEENIKGSAPPYVRNGLTPPYSLEGPAPPYSRRVSTGH
jgi:hypothetical protein